jgi:hypothetical protein
MRKCFDFLPRRGKTSVVKIIGGVWDEFHREMTLKPVPPERCVFLILFTYIFFVKIIFIFNIYYYIRKIKQGFILCFVNIINFVGSSPA